MSWIAQEEILAAFTGGELPPMVVARCSLCRKGLPSVGNRNLHVRSVHERRRAAFCDDEGYVKRFDSPCRLRAHVRAKHLNLRDFVCAVPNYKCGFNERSKMLRHVQKLHEKRTGRPTRCVSIQ